jgi:hypothetical protein
VAPESHSEQGTNVRKAATPAARCRAELDRRVPRPAGSAEGELARGWDQEHDRHLFERLLAIVQPDFHPTTWEAFRRFALDGLPAAQVATELALTEGAVLPAKARILKRLRHEAGDLSKSFRISASGWSR